VLSIAVFLSGNHVLSLDKASSNPGGDKKRKFSTGLSKIALRKNTTISAVKTK